MTGLPILGLKVQGGTAILAVFSRAGSPCYADLMGTDEFRAAVQELLSTAAKSCTSVMCAEKFYWKCHRRLLGDYLVAQGVEVVHIVGPGKLSIHKLTPYTVTTEDGIIYPSPRPVFAARHPPKGVPFGTVDDGRGSPETNDTQKSFLDLDAQAEQG